MEISSGAEQKPNERYLNRKEKERGIRVVKFLCITLLVYWQAITAIKLICNNFKQWCRDKFCHVMLWLITSKSDPLFAICRRLLYEQYRYYWEPLFSALTIFHFCCEVKYDCSMKNVRHVRWAPGYPAIRVQVKINVHNGQGNFCAFFSVRKTAEQNRASRRGLWVAWKIALLSKENFCLLVVCFRNNIQNEKPWAHRSRNDPSKRFGTHKFIKGVS